MNYTSETPGTTRPPVLVALWDAMWKPGWAMGVKDEHGRAICNTVALAWSNGVDAEPPF